MNKQVYKTNKVLGYKSNYKYDKIDLFVDITNQNNLWAILHSTQLKNGKPYDYQEIIRFSNYDEMMRFLRSNFDCSELNNRVNINNRHIFFHFIDYYNINYILYEGKPKLNYLELNYVESENGSFHRKKMFLPKEYEKMFDEIIRINKKIPISQKDIGNLHLTTDVYGNRKQARKDNIRKYTVPIGNFINNADIKFRNIKINGKNNKKNINSSSRFVKGIKIIGTASLIVAIMTTGYNLMKNSIYNSEYLEQKNPITSMKDVNIYFNKGDNGIILDKLMNQDYDNISKEELDKFVSFMRKIDMSNYDNNSSFNSFDYDEYFDYKLIDRDNYFDIKEMLEKIEKLYKRAFIIDKKVTINKERAKEYIDYVASLTFMYDAYHDTRGTLLQMNNQSIISKTATTEEIRTFDSLPPILKMIIINQLRGVLTHTDYKVSKKPLYYFKSTEKNDLLIEIDKVLTNIYDYLNSECGYIYIGKSSK